MPIKTYIVSLEARASISQPSETKTVRYEAEDYHAAWVGARNVCRWGTQFRDDPNCKTEGARREFYVNDEQRARFPVAAGVYIVRSIFVEDTRKTGKSRMTTISVDELKRVLGEQNIPMNKKLTAALTEALGSEGLRLTVATARRLGVNPDPSPEDSTPNAS